MWEDDWSRSDFLLNYALSFEIWKFPVSINYPIQVRLAKYIPNSGYQELNNQWVESLVFASFELFHKPCCSKTLITNLNGLGTQQSSHVLSTQHFLSFYAFIVHLFKSNNSRKVKIRDDTFHALGRNPDCIRWLMKNFACPRFSLITINLQSCSKQVKISPFKN